MGPEKTREIGAASESGCLIQRRIGYRPHGQPFAKVGARLSVSGLFTKAGQWREVGSSEDGDEHYGEGGRGMVMGLEEATHGVNISNGSTRGYMLYFALD